MMKLAVSFDIFNLMVSALSIQHIFSFIACLLQVFKSRGEKVNPREIASKIVAAVPQNDIIQKVRPQTKYLLITQSALMRGTLPYHPEM